MDGKRKTCFVIMPFSKTTEEHDEEYWDSSFATIKKIMEELGYDCTRSEVGPYDLVSNIISNIIDSNIVVAVLTDFNPNVWYELGARHTLKTGTIMLLQDNHVSPFDIRNYGIIYYKDFNRLEDLKKRIKHHLDKYNDDTCDSPIIQELRRRKMVEELSTQKSTDGIRQNRILWVDDYPNNNIFAINYLENMNICVDIALSTKKGVDLFREKENSYDVIITDMGRGLEWNAGITLIKELKDLGCKVPIIVYTNYDGVLKFGNDALSLGAYRVISYGIIPAIYEILGFHDFQQPAS